MYMDVGENGSTTAFKIFDCSTIGLPFVLLDFAAFRARSDSEASVWKKCPGSVDRDIFAIFDYVEVPLVRSLLCGYGGVQSVAFRGVDSCRDPRVKWNTSRRVFSSFNVEAGNKTLCHSKIRHGDNCSDSSARQTSSYCWTNVPLIYP